MADYLPPTDEPLLIRVDALIRLLLDRKIAPAEHAELDRAIRAHPAAAERYVLHMDMHAMLGFVHGQVGIEPDAPGDIDREVFQEIIELALEQRRQTELEDQARAQLAAQQRADRAPATPIRIEPGTPAPRVVVIPRWLVHAAAVLALTALGWIAWAQLGPAETDRVAEQTGPADPAPDATAALPTQAEPDPSTAPGEPAPATMLRQHAAQWALGGPDADDRLAAGTHVLTLGYCELRFADGATAVLQAPATFRLINGSRMALDQGLVSADVPEGAEGFTVATPTGEFIDLGTSFGVEVAGAVGQPIAQRVAELHVFEGEVQARPSNSTTSAIVTTALAVQVRPDADAPLIPVTIREEKFVRDWRDTAQPLSATQRIRHLYQPPASVKPGDLEHNDHAYVFLERPGVVLTREVQTGISEPGRYSHMRRTGQPVPAGTRVDSYLVHFDRVSNAGRLEKVGGIITFDRPILGIIVNGRQIDATHDLFAHPDVAYGTGLIDSGLEGDERGFIQDELLLTRDRKTLTLRFESGPRIDQVRVLVQAQDPDEPSAPAPAGTTD